MSVSMYPFEGDGEFVMFRAELSIDAKPSEGSSFTWNNLLPDTYTEEQDLDQTSE